MDSDEDDGFPIDEAENSRRNVVFQDGKLSDILDEVKTKIPSLDFDDDTHDVNDDIAQLHFEISDDNLMPVCEDHPTIHASNNVSVYLTEERYGLPDNVNTDNTHSKEESRGLPDNVETGSTYSQEGSRVLPDNIQTGSACSQEGTRVLPNNVQTDSTHSEKASANQISQTFDSQNPVINKLSNKNQTVDNSIKLDFNKLYNIDFNQVETTLGQLTIDTEKSSSVYDIDACEEKLPEYPDETSLMERLCDLSKDQLNSCCSITKNKDREVHVLHLENVKEKSFSFNENSHGAGSISTKAIHSWTQLESDNTISEQPKTIFLDLRPETPTEDEMALKKHTTSIQRILGLHDQRSACNSDDDSDNELEDWHEMRNKYKEKVFKQKEYYEKSAKTDRKIAGNSSSVQVTSNNGSEKRTFMEEIYAEELIGGIPSDDENTMHSSETCITSTWEEPSNRPELAESEVNRKRTNDVNSKMDQEEEMIKQPDVTRKHQIQHGKEKVTFFRANGLTSKTELADYSKNEQGVEHEKRNARGTATSQLQFSDNDLLMPSNRKTCLPDRPAYNVDKMVQVEDLQETCDSELQNGTNATRKNNKSSTYYKNEQTLEFKDDEQIKIGQSTRSKCGHSKTKGDSERTLDAKKKLVDGKEAYKKLTAVKKTEDNVPETKVKEALQPLANNTKLDKEQAVDQIEIASKQRIEEKFKKNLDSKVGVEVEKIEGVCLDKVNLVTSEVLEASSGSDEINVEDVYEGEDSVNNTGHGNKIIEIIVDVERKDKSGYNKKKKVQRKTIKKSPIHLKKLKMENEKESTDLQNQVERIKRQGYHGVTGDKKKMNNKKCEEDAEETIVVEDKNKAVAISYEDDEKEEDTRMNKIRTNKERSFLTQENVKADSDVNDPRKLIRVKGEKELVFNTNGTFVGETSNPLEERIGLCEEKNEKGVLVVGNTSDLRKHCINVSAQEEIDFQEISDKDFIKAEEPLRRGFDEYKVCINRPHELKEYLSTNIDISKECLRSTVQTSSDIKGKLKLDKVSAVLRKAGRFLTNDDSEEQCIFDPTTKKGKSVSAISKPEKREVGTSTENFDIPLFKACEIIEKMKQLVTRKENSHGFARLEKAPKAHESNSEIKMKRDLLFNTEDSVSLRKLQNSDLKSQLKQLTPKERKELKEKIREKIDSMRTTVSGNGKYPAAVNTPIIYDQEASYEQECHGLLPGAEDQLSLLLVVTLIGCGEMNVQRSKGKAFGTLPEINCYFALIAWFLSLGGAYNCDGGVPFSIIAMQQVYQNGKLQLFVGVHPNETVYDVSTGKGLKNKIKCFNKAISKYLSTHSLRSVYQNMMKADLGGSYLVDDNLYNSKMLSSCITVGQDPNAVQRVFACSKTGFFWETLEVVDTNEVFQDGSCRDFTTENTIVLVQPSLYHRPSCVLDLLCHIEDEGCDIAGLRLAYCETYEASDATIFLSHGDHEIVQSREYLGPRHTLALAVRGPSAISKMTRIIGLKHPPRDVLSLRCLYCPTMCEDKLFYCPSYSNQAAVNLARWFGGRVTEKELTDVDQDKCHVGSKSDCSLSDGVLAQKPPALLISSTQTAFYLITSPLIPPSFLGHVLHICNQRGFSIRRIQRMHISKRHGNNLGLSQLQQAAFCPLSASSPFQSPNESPPDSPARGKVTFNFESVLVSSRSGRAYPSTLIVLQKENGIYHSTTLIKQLSESLAEWKKNDLSDLLNFDGNPWRLYFCIMQFNEINSKALWDDVVQSPDTIMLSRARCHDFLSNPEDEQVCVLCAVTEKAVQYIGLLLKILYSESNPVAGNWELLAIKSFPSLSLIQAREVTPIEVGEQSWEISVKNLMSTALFACVLRGVNMIERLREFMVSFLNMSFSKDICVLSDLHYWLSQTSEVSFRQIAALFEERELFPDENNRANMKYAPPIREKVSYAASKSMTSKVVYHKKQRRRFQTQVAEDKNNVADDSSTSVDTIQYNEMPIIQSLLVGPRPITTLALIKPSCLLNTKNLGKIFKSICQENFNIVALRMSVLTAHEAEVLVRSDDTEVSENVKYLTCSASLLMCLQRVNAVKKLLDILGPEDPVIARSLDPFLLRGCYGVDAIHNSMHGSETYSASLCEMKMLFPCGLCCDSTVDLEAEQIPCRAYDETIGKNAERKLIKTSRQQPAEIEQSLVSFLVQINCLVLTCHIVYGRFGRKRIALVDVLECLLSLNFIPVGMKMALLSQEQVDNCLNIIGSTSGEKQKLRNELTEGPCIVIALQRDNAITCFDTIIESAQEKCRSLGDYRKHIIQGSTEEEARNLLLYFFDRLVPNCIAEICAA